MSDKENRINGCIECEREMSSNRSKYDENKLSVIVREMDDSNGSMVTMNELNNDVLLIIFSHLNLKQQFYMTGVCNRWRNLIHWTFTQKKSLSFVNNANNLFYWKTNNWYELIQTAKDTIRCNFNITSDLVEKVIAFCPNIRRLDVGYFHLGTNTVSLIASICPNLERINFDGVNGFDIDSIQCLANGFSELKILNLSYCSLISEIYLSLILQSLPNLTALNVSGTAISGLCLSLIGKRMSHLNISYCWNIRAVGLMALSTANCHDLKELSINNFNFESSQANDCLEAICNAFHGLKYLYLDKSSGFYVNSLNFQGFTAIGRLNQLEKLLIRNVCILDDISLQAILYGCRLLKNLSIDMFPKSNVTDISIVLIPQYCTSLKRLEISHNNDITEQTIIDIIRRLPHLRKLILRFMNINDSVPIFAVNNCLKLKKICLNGCRKIKQRSLLEFIEKAKLNPFRKFNFIAIQSGIMSSLFFVINGNKIKTQNIPNNITFKISNWHQINYIGFKSGQYFSGPISHSI